VVRLNVLKTCRALSRRAPAKKFEMRYARTATLGRMRGSSFALRWNVKMSSNASHSVLSHIKTSIGSTIGNDRFIVGDI
jgi:hypothetical protein